MKINVSWVDVRVTALGRVLIKSGRSEGPLSGANRKTFGPSESYRF